MRLGIAIRLIGIVALVAVIGLNGTALKSKAFDEKTGHYTVVLKPGENASLISSEHKADGVKLEHIANDGVDAAYVATMSDDKAKDLLKDSRVAYIALDGTMTVHHTYIETMKLTIDRQFSTIFS